MRSSIAAAGIGVWEWDAQRDVTWWSAELKAIFGLPADAPISRRTVFDALHPDTAAQARSDLAEALARHADHRARYRILRLDGAERWIESSSRGEYDSAGQPLRLVGIVHDVTDAVRAERFRSRSEHGFRTLVESISQFVWHADARGDVTAISGAIEQQIGIGPEQIKGARWLELLHPDDYAGAKSAWEQAVATGEAFAAEFRLRGPQGRYRYFFGQAIHLGTGADAEHGAAADSPAAEQWLGILSDIDDRKRASLALKASEEKLESILDCLTDLVWSVSTVDDEVVYFGPVVEHLSGRPAADFIADRELWLKMVHPDDQPRVRQAIAGAFRNGSFDIEYRFVHADGGTRWVRNRGKAIRDAAGHIVRLDGVVSDITQQRAQKEQIDYLSYCDPLTGLANRRTFVERLDQFMQSAGGQELGLAVLVLDLANFKSVNDTFGVSAGDELLKRIGRRLLRIAGSQNLVARLGGDRFAVIVSGIRRGADLAPVLHERVWQSLGRPYRLREHELRVDGRAGIALFPEDGVTGDAVLQNAEAALKKAKTSGERLLMYTPAMTLELKRKLDLETGLRRALERSEFVVHYQPRVDLQSGAICGSEALLRWNKPGTGVVLPGEFLAALEESGLILEVGRWVLQQAVADGRRWRAGGLPVLPVAVNLSPGQLRQPDFVAWVAELAGSAGRGQLKLEVEVTESVLMQDVERTIDTLRALRERGVTVAIDDFGAGYSSLAYLSRLPVDALRIDRSFIRAMTDNATNMGIVSTIISLARSMNLRVTAEGVETPEQLQFLRLLRCDEMQGFLFSAALPAEQFAAMLGSGRAI
ncbi:MAG: EAL domain-containing protein [Nevskia sp.]|nr:EAL domain-containing protein [Nevskia sp.]